MASRMRLLPRSMKLEKSSRTSDLLWRIQDNYEKIVLTLDRFSLGNYDGIKVMNCQHHGKALPPTHRPENTAAERRHNCF